MKATCINSEGWADSDTNEDTTGPSLGDIVHITGFYLEETNGLIYFYLEEWPPDNQRDGYEASWFVFIEDLEIPESEKELITEKNYL